LRRLWLVASLVATLLVTAAGGAYAIDDDKSDIAPPGRDAQHGEAEGHLPGTVKNVKLISKLRLTENEGGIADVGFFKGYAYLAAWAPDCPDGGVHIVDIRNRLNPTKVAFAPAGPKDYVGEGVHIFHMRSTDQEDGTGVLFEGDVLAVNHEACTNGDPEAEQGMSLWDVSDPTNPEPLAQHFGDTLDGHTISYHSIMGWSEGGKAYVVGVDNEEFPDVDIFDVSDPARPVLISEIGFDGDIPEWNDILVNARGDLAFHHDMDLKKIDGHWFMMVSYWDGGWVKVNVDDPANPVMISESDYAADDPQIPGFDPEGNAHQGEWNWNNNLWIGTDEDFGPYRPGSFQITSGPNAGTFPSAPIGGAAPVTILPDRVLNGPTVNGGYGCPDDPATPANEGSAPVPLRSDYTDLELGLTAGEEAIMVLQRGPTNDPDAPEPACFPGGKAQTAIDAGWDAVVLVNRHLSPPDPEPPFCGSGDFRSTIAAVCTSHTAFHHMFNSTPDHTIPYDNNLEPDIGDIGQDVEADALFDGWGYVHMLNANTMADLDTYQPAVAKLEANGVGQGILSVHEVATDHRKNLGYLAYYGAGLRVIKYSAANGITEVGRYIHVNGNDFWGVQLLRRGPNKRPLILMSDRDSGLMIFKYTGPE
jgi:hypothetical protein